MTVERTYPPLVADERTMLISWLEYHRATLARKCDGVPPERLSERTALPSSLSLLGLVRHLGEVELGWFRVVMAGEDVLPRYYSREDPDGDIANVDGANVDEAFANWDGECDFARRYVEDAESLDVLGRERNGRQPSLRWVLVHMIEEYARHNGHADLLRERLDGVVGE